MTRSLCVLALVFGSFFFFNAYAKSVELSVEHQTYYDHLQKQAFEKKLFEKPMWRVLLHYKKNMWGGWKSQVDAGNFFLAKKGKTQPFAELRATLKAFFEAPGEDINVHPQCRFPARYHWLKQELGFDAARLPEVTCVYFEQIYQLAKPETISVIFPSTHPNSPSSMFGHTLIRLDKAGRNEATRMLNYSINFAADVNPNDNALFYGLKGIVGGYPGRFTFTPYYIKLREYAQMESRDIWEYTLDLSAEQVRFVLMHASELEQVYFDYFYFTENCSYHLLSLIDVLVVENTFTDETKPWTLPVDTVKQLFNRKLIKDIAFRPSTYRKIRHRQQLMGDDERDLALRLSLNDDSQALEAVNEYSVDRRAMIFDLSYDYARYRRVDDSDKVEVGLSPTERRLLGQRSKLDYKSPPLEIETPQYRPDEGHGTTRFALGGGVLEDDAFVELEFRGAYHDALDPSPGYPYGAAIDFFKVKARKFDYTDAIYLESFTLANILSVPVWDAFFKNMSWYAHLGWNRYTVAKGVSLSEIASAIGFGATVGSETLRVYGLLDAQLNESEHYLKNHILAPGIKVGVTGSLFSKLNIHLEAEARKGVLKEKSESFKVAYGQSFSVSRNLSLRIDLNRQHRAGYYWTEAQFRVMSYF